MPARRIFGPTKVNSTSAGAQRTYVLDVLPGGDKAKVVQFAVVSKLRSSANCYLSLDLEHGLNGQHFATHSTPIAYAAAPDGGTLMGHADTSIVLGEHRRAKLYVKDNTATAEEWAVVEVWELLKPF